MLRIFVGVIQSTWTVALGPVAALRRISAVSKTPSRHLHRADEAPEHVDVVHGEIEDDVVAGELGGRVAADPREGEVNHRAEPALAYHFAELAHGRVEALDVADHELRALGLRRLHELERLRVGARDGLLDEHVLAQRDELGRHVAVGRRRGRDDGRVEVDRRELCDTAREPRGAEVARLGRGRVDDRDELERGDLAQDAEVILAHAAEADEGDLDLACHGDHQMAARNARSAASRSSSRIP
jgi:hypothetical protein